MDGENYIREGRGESALQRNLHYLDACNIDVISEKRLKQLLCKSADFLVSKTIFSLSIRILG